jgi:hypothetical protein
MYSTVYSIVYSYFSGIIHRSRMLQKCYYQSITSLVLYIDWKQVGSEGEVSEKQKSKHVGSPGQSEALSYSRVSNQSVKYNFSNSSY